MQAGSQPTTVFCDFDGTMTMDDMIIAVWRRFAPAGWESTVEEMFAQRKSLREGVAEIFATMPSHLAPEIAEFVRTEVRFRPGLQDFLEFCRAEGIDFLVVSGGIDFFLEPVLAPYRPWVRRIHSIPADLTGPTIRLRHPDGCERCGLCKAAVIDLYPGMRRVLVGDSITDLHGAEQADLVFARGRLPGLLAERGIRYRAFETFVDIKQAMASIRLPGSGHPSIGSGQALAPEAGRDADGGST